MRPLLKWDSAPDDEIIARFTAMQRFAKAVPFFGDIAFYNLNYVPVLIKTFLNAKVIYLTRPRQAVIESYKKVLQEWPKVRGVYPDHWTDNPDDRYTTVYDVCFPSYDEGTLDERIGRYIDDYETIANRLVHLYPDSIYKTDMQTLFSSAECINRLFDWVGFPSEGHVVKYICEVNHNKV